MGGPLALCVAAAAALTPIVAPRASITTRAPLVHEVQPFTPPEPVRPAPAESPAIAEMLIVGRGGLAPIEPAFLLFPPAGGGVQALIVTSALANDLPPDFFLRLLRQESGLNPNAVSPVGAQGIAQFMPGTAAERGLRNPFDPGEAIPKSAALLREHHARFGNLGLAAAAYNAGPQRVRGWLEGRSGMPAETRDYVARITGRPLEDWARESGRAVPSAFAAISAPPFAWAAQTGPTARPLNLFEPAPAPRAAPMPAKRGPSRSSLRTPQPRSEQALCAVLNNEGRSCLVQAFY